MKITIAGGGNIGTQFAVHIAEKGHEVIMFTSNPGVFSGRLSIVDKEGNTIHEGTIGQATNDPGKAFRGSDVIIITMPPTMMIPLSEMIYDNTDESTIIGFVPGNGGFELAFRKCIERGNIFFGIDRVPVIARLTKRGREVCCSGYKDELYVGAIPSKHTEKCAALIESIFDTPCVRLPGFMALTLTPSNPILHTARLRTIFNDYRPGVTYDSLPLFYEDWDDASSELLLACDDEIQDICRALPGFGLEYVISERTFYKVKSTEQMTKAISSEESLKGLTTPSVKAEAAEIKGRGLGGIRTRRKFLSERIARHIERRAYWRERMEKRMAACCDEQKEETGNTFIPDLHSRYFTADFPYGLSVIQQIGNIAGVDMPNIDSLIDWYDEIAIVNDKLIISDYGISDMDTLREFYMQ